MFSYHYIYQIKEHYYHYHHYLGQVTILASRAPRQNTLKDDGIVPLLIQLTITGTEVV